MGAGSDDDQRGPFAFAEWVTLPAITDARWLEALREVVESRKIDVIFPAHDDVLVATATRRSEIPADVIVPSAATCVLTRSKRSTYERLGEQVPVPHVLDASVALDYPVFVKPDRGEGSRGAKVVHDRTELEAPLADGSDLAMELLPGEELTVDCFSSAGGGPGVRSCENPRGDPERHLGRSHSVGDRQQVTDLARVISDELALRGPWFFQLRADVQGVPTLLEVAPG